MGRLRGTVAAALIVACGSAQRPEAPRPPPPEIKTYAPLGLKADAKAPNQAVILGTDAKNGSTVLVLPVGQSPARVDAMTVRLGATAVGGIAPVKLATAPNPDGSVQVGVYEELAGGAGPQWRAGVWISAFVAATALGKDLTDFTFSASTGGYIDGPSASGLMAGGFLAALTGQAIDPTVTMTGAITPDGTIGPVDGIPEKFLASIEKGKKRLGYPLGMRIARSEATGQDVNLVALAKQHGVEAVEIADAHAAYKLLTGKSLPEAVPVTEAEMALDAATVKALDAKYTVWRRRVATEWANVVQLESAGRLPPTLAAMRALAQQYGEAAEALYKRGLVGAAYIRILSAWVYASGVGRAYKIVAAIQGPTMKKEQVLAALEAGDARVGLVFERVGSLRPTTIGGHLQMLAGFQAALRAWVYDAFASEVMTATRGYVAALTDRSDRDKITATIAPSILYVMRANVAIELALEELDFENENDVNYMCSLPNVQRMATSFHSASTAGLNYFDTLIVQPAADQAKLSQDEARKQIAMLEPDYLVAFVAATVTDGAALGELKTRWGEQTLPWGLLSLAASQLAYFNVSELIAKYYSIGVKKDDSGRISGVVRDKAFASMLASAERNARANARAARIATGAIPVQAKLAYQIATVERSGAIDDQLDALGNYWSASAFAQTAVMLARN